MVKQLVLVKHAQPILDPAKPAREWELGAQGEAQAKLLAQSLRRFLPFRLVASPEPKALRTAEIVSAELSVAMRCVEALRELDRPVLPILDAQEHHRLNAEIFADLSKPVIGRESGSQAVERFSAAVVGEIDQVREAANLVVVAHGTVIALFVAQHNGLSGLDLWARLRCPSFVVLDFPSFGLVQVVESISAA